MVKNDYHYDFKSIIIIYIFMTDERNNNDKLTKDKPMAWYSRQQAIDLSQYWPRTFVNFAWESKFKHLAPL